MDVEVTLSGRNVELYSGVKSIDPGKHFTVLVMECENGEQEIWLPTRDIERLVMNSAG